MKKLTLLFTLFTLSLHAELLRNDTNQTVYDSETKLTWQDNYDLNGGNVKLATWKEAISYCESLTISGEGGWRLPNRNELFSLIDYTRTNPTLDNTKFLNTVSSTYWTSSTNNLNFTTAWAITFNYGQVNTGSSKNSSSYVRCVKGGI